VTVWVYKPASPLSPLSGETVKQLVMPAEAGIQAVAAIDQGRDLDSRFRGNDDRFRECSAAPKEEGGEGDRSKVKWNGIEMSS
jgi:hypothetical protein